MSEGELARLRDRKKELLLESDINRQILRVEVCQLQLKAAEWRSGWGKARTAYQWLAPAAGMLLALYGMKRKWTAAADGTHNGHGTKSAYLNLLAPVGLAALRKALGFWQAAKERKAERKAERKSRAQRR